MGDGGCCGCDLVKEGLDSYAWFGNCEFLDASPIGKRFEWAIIDMNLEKDCKLRDNALIYRTTSCPSLRRQ